MKILFVDVETGGLDPAKHSLLSIAAVVWEDGKLGNAISIDIEHEVYCVTSEAMAINKIDLSKHKGYSPSETAYHLRTWLYKNFNHEDSETVPPIVIGGQNIQFDWGFISKQLNHYDLTEQFSHRKQDTMSVIRFLRLAGKLPEFSGLEGAIKHFNLEVPDRHTALGDARAAAMVFTECLKLVGGCDGT